VALTGVLGALAASSRRRALIASGPVILVAPALAAAILVCAVDPFVLANAEHALGFALGALVGRERTARQVPGLVSLEQVLGQQIFARLHDDWREDQADAVRSVLADDGMHVWVGEAEPGVVGFVAATLHHRQRMGEISMLAVDPDHPREGLGTALTGLATDWLRRSEMRIAMVETGGDAGHAAARRV
jgi:GNAT superfamily N-acetyltransferase